MSDGTNSSRSYGPEHSPFMLSREDLPFCNNIPARLNLKLLYTRYFIKTSFRKMGKMITSLLETRTSTELCFLWRVSSKIVFGVTKYDLDLLFRYLAIEVAAVGIFVYSS